MNQIKLFLRPQRSGAFSIENLFRTLLPYIQEQMPSELCIIQHASRGLKCRWQMLQEVKRERSLLVNHITGEVNFIALALDRQRTILTIHDLESLDRKQKFPHYLIRFFWLYLPLKRVQYVTVISEASKRKLLQGFPFLKEEAVKVIANCLTSDIDFSEKKLNPQEPVILQIGTKENKNLPNLIKAIAPLNCRLLLVGQLSEEIRQLLSENGIVFENFVNISNEEIKVLYRQCDIVTLVSLYEGFGLPILEGNAAGRPVITSNISSMPEAAGDAALLVDPTSVVGIREAIVSLVDSQALRVDLIRKGRKNILRFTPEAVATQYVQLYKQIIAAHEA